MDRPKLEMRSNKEEVVTMNWSPDMKHDTNKEMIKYVGKKIGALGVCKLSAGQLTTLLDFCLTNNIMMTRNQLR